MRLLIMNIVRERVYPTLFPSEGVWKGYLVHEVQRLPFHVGRSCFSFCLYRSHVDYSCEEQHVDDSEGVCGNHYAWRFW